MAKISWTEKEIAKLKSMYEFSSKEDILSEFTPRNWPGIELRGRTLGLSRLANPKIPWTEEELLIIKEKYKDSSRELTLSLLPNRTWKSIREKANSFGINRDSELVNKEMVQTGIQNNLENYGVEYSWQRQDVQDQIKKVHLEKRGVDHVSKSDAVKETKRINNLIVGGHSCSLHFKQSKEKTRATLEKNYQVSSPLQSPVIRERVRQTNQKNLGVDNVFQSEEIKEKSKKTNLERYGAENPQQNKEIREKTEYTCLTIYGGVAPACSKEVQIKMEHTNFELYGVKAPSQNDAVKEKALNTFRANFGVSNHMKLDVYKEKVRDTNLKKYGVPCVLSLKEYRHREKALETMRLNKSFSKSKPELKLLDYFRKHLDINIEHQKKHPLLGHVLDYYSPHYDVWMQFDGIYWHGKRLKNKEDLKLDPNFFSKQSQSYGIYNNMFNDEIQNENIPNLIRFWEDDFYEAWSNDSMESYVKSKFLGIGIVI